MSDKFWTTVAFSAIVFCDLYCLAALKIVHRPRIELGLTCLDIQ